MKNIVKLQNATLDLPVYDAKSRLATSQVLHFATCGRLEKGSNGGGVVVRALYNVSLTASSGDRVGILGHNGAGNSTLVRVSSGAFRPTSGVAEVEAKVGSIIDISLGINLDVTGKENILMRPAYLGISKTTVIFMFQEIVEFSDLGAYIDLPARTYSSGVHLRFAFAVSTVVRPEVLLMDEWLSMGDEAFKQKAEIRLQSLVDSSEVPFMASHSRNLV